MNGVVVALTRNGWCLGELYKYVEHILVGSLLIATIAMGWIWWSNWPKTPLEAVTLLSADVQTATVPAGGTLRVLSKFLKNRSDCHNGRVTRHMAKADGVWITVVDQRPVLRAVADREPQLIERKIPLVDVETGLPVPPGLYSMVTTVFYDCPHLGKLRTLDDTISSQPFEVVAR